MIVKRRHKSVVGRYTDIINDDEPSISGYTPGFTKMLVTGVDGAMWVVGLSDAEIDRLHSIRHLKPPEGTNG